MCSRGRCDQQIWTRRYLLFRKTHTGKATTLIITHLSQKNYLVTNTPADLLYGAYYREQRDLYCRKMFIFRWLSAHRKNQLCSLGGRGLLSLSLSFINHSKTHQSEHVWGPVCSSGQIALTSVCVQYHTVTSANSLIPMRFLSDHMRWISPLMICLNKTTDLRSLNIFSWLVLTLRVGGASQQSKK